MQMYDFTIHFNKPIFRGDRVLFRTTYGNTAFDLGNVGGANVTSRIVPTPSGGLELTTIRNGGQVVAFEFDSLEALEFQDFINSKLPPALRPAPMHPVHEMQILLLSRYHDPTRQL